MKSTEPSATPADIAGLGRRQAVGIVVIGDEVLSNKVEDENTPRIIATMASNGVDVGEVAMIGDVPDRIAAVVRDFAQRFDFVVTTGGIGPTHDDCTWRAVGAAFDRPIELHERLWAAIRQWLKGEPTEYHRRMAMLPRGADVLFEGGHYLPVFENVYVLPGVPSMVHARLPIIAKRHAFTQRSLATVYFAIDEWKVVDRIDAAVASFSELAVGSYPVFDAKDHKLRVTFEGDDRPRVQEAVTALVASIGETEHVRTTWRKPGAER